MVNRYWHRQLTIVLWLIGELTLVVSYAREIISNTVYREKLTKQPSNLRCLNYSLKTLVHLTVSASVGDVLQQEQMSQFCHLNPVSARANSGKDEAEDILRSVRWLIARLGRRMEAKKESDTSGGSIFELKCHVPYSADSEVHVHKSQINY